jgi:hypothetical protein
VLEGVQYPSIIGEIYTWCIYPLVVGHSLGTNYTMTTLTPDDLRKRLETELKKIDGDIGLLPEINNSNDFAKPFIEIDRYGYNYVCRERGEEIFRKIPYDTDELLFEVLGNLTFEMATKWEAKTFGCNFLQSKLT